MPPAARVTDMHACPMVDPGPKPHVGGPVMPAGEPTVLIGFMPAARLGDMSTCAGPPDTITQGEPSVLIGDKPAARLGDPTAHGGVIVAGCPTVLIGSSAQAVTLVQAAFEHKAFCEECERAKGKPPRAVDASDIDMLARRLPPGKTPDRPDPLRPSFAAGIVNMDNEVKPDAGQAKDAGPGPDAQKPETPADAGPAETPKTTPIVVNIILIPLGSSIGGGELESVCKTLRKQTTTLRTGEIERDFANNHVSFDFVVKIEKERTGKARKSYKALDFPVYLSGDETATVSPGRVDDFLEEHGVPKMYRGQDLHDIVHAAWKSDPNGATAPASPTQGSHAKFSLVNVHRRRKNCGGEELLCVSNTILHEVIHQADLPGHDSPSDAEDGKNGTRLMYEQPHVDAGKQSLIPQLARRRTFFDNVRILSRMQK